MKKTILIFFAFCMMLTMMFASPMQVLAAKEEKTVLVMKGKENVETHEIEVDVIVEENTGVCGMLLSLDYDTSVFTLTGLKYGTAFSSLSPIHTNSETDAGYGIYPFKITYLGEQNDTSTGNMMTLRFSVNDGAPDGDYTIALSHERDKGVTYLTENEIRTKNLLIDSAKITLYGSRITNIDTLPHDGQQNDAINGSDEIWIPILIGGFVLIGGSSLLISMLIRRNKLKKWKKI